MRQHETEPQICLILLKKIYIDYRLLVVPVHLICFGLIANAEQRIRLVE